MRGLSLKRSSPLARAKNTARAEARRRTRALTRAEIDDAELEAADEAVTADDEAPAAEARRPAFGFRLPNFRQDLRDLPQILTSRRAMVLAPLMLVLGFALQLASAYGVLAADYGVPIPLIGWISFLGLAEIFVQMFFLPPALLTFFLAGYIAPRASYLVGALLGAVSGAMWSILVLTTPPTTGTPLASESDPGGLMVYLFALNVGYGTFAAAFAAWYRDFLRRMRDQGTSRRADREAQERAKRRDQRQEDRRALKKSGR
jgi:hypothetical protein